MPAPRHPFAIFWSTQTISLVGLQIGQLALPLVALDTLSAGADTVSLITAAASAPWLLFGLVAGVLADRLPRRTMLLLAHAGRVLVLLTVPVAHLTGLLTVAQLIMVAFLTGIFAVAFETGSYAYLPDLLPDAELTAANRKLSITDGAARTGGPGLAGLVIQAIGAPLALAGQALTHLICAIGTTRLPDGRRSSPQRLRAADLVAGFRVVLRDRLLRKLIISEIAFLFAFSFTFAAILASYRNRLGLDPGAIGLIFTIGAVGGLAGSLLYAAAARLCGDTIVMRVGVVLRALGIAAVPLALIADGWAFAALAGCRALTSFGWAWWDIPRITLIQTRTETAVLGRVNAVALVTAQVGELLGALGAAALLGLLGLSGAIIVGGSTALAAAIWFAIRR